MKFSNLISHILRGETQSTIHRSWFCPAAGAADVGKVFTFNNVCEGVTAYSYRQLVQPNLSFLNQLEECFRSAPFNANLWVAFDPSWIGQNSAFVAFLLLIYWVAKIYSHCSTNWLFFPIKIKW